MRTSRLLVGLLALPFVAVASTLVPHTLAQRAAESDRVALVQVLSQKVEPASGSTPMKTFTRVAIGRDLKGKGPQELTIVQIGGVAGTQSMRIPGDAFFDLGETAVVFLRCRLAVDRCHLVALGEGKLELKGSKLLAHDLFTGGWRQLTVDELANEIAPNTAPTIPTMPTTGGVTR